MSAVIGSSDLDEHTLGSGGASGNQLRQLAASMGHDVRTHMKHYGQWTDEAGLDAAFDAANAKLNESLTKRQQQMQQQQWQVVLERFV